MDEVFVEGVRVLARLGVGEDERRLGCWVEVDVRAGLAHSAAGDDLARSVDYTQLAEACAAAASVETRTVERFCERVAESVLAHPNCAEVRVEARKLAASAPLLAEYGACVVRTRPRREPA